MRLAILVPAVLAVALLATGCQAYEFEPVVPRTLVAARETHEVESRKLPPSLMLVVDRSGSMTDAADGSATGCTVAGVYDAGSAVPCKWNDLKRLVTGPGGFLTANASIANFGLVLFAGDEECGAGTVASAVGADAEGAARAAEVARLIGQATPKGGTPTALSLGHVLDDPRMHEAEPGRDRLVMLLTDGAPNCNPANAALCTSACKTNPATCAQAGQCQPTFGCDNVFAGAGCLDEDGTVTAVRRLADRGVRTFVIGFGAATGDPSSAAWRVLDSAAQAGGLARKTGARFYQANSAQELSDALAELIKVINRCDYTLAQPPDRVEQVEVAFVYADGHEEVLVPPAPEVVGEWEWDADAGKVTVTGARCAEIQAGTKGLAVEIRYVDAL